MIELKIANRKGHETQILSEEDAERLIEVERGRYYILDPETHSILRKIDVGEHEALMLLPIPGGG
ncbi:MAG: hypothetical protein OEZ48_00265 [Candidatus Bathyarchaeota archaeon]|nr:hypothetical protein [Candidatus Bathyarchaeota archaeon]MDH5686290.1 hypothetical protein [Candidatus Bathyarchaeota archaeon]